MRKRKGKGNAHLSEHISRIRVEVFTELWPFEIERHDFPLLLPPD